MAKKIKVKVAPVEAAKPAVDQLAVMKYKLEKFKTLRSNALTAEELKNASFWVDHYTTKVQELEQK